MNRAASNVEWRAYGKLDYGASRDFDSGRREWAMLRDHLRQYGLDVHDHAVEIGCGEGRLTQALAQDFLFVDALDISESRLDRAKQNVNAANVNWRLIDGPPLPLNSDSVHLIISTHVIQHIHDQDTVIGYFTESHRLLRTGGVLLMHIPVVGAHGSTGRLGEVLKRTCKDAAKAVVLGITRGLMRLGVQKLPWKIDFYRWYNYPWLCSTLQEVGFADVEIRILPWSGGHSYVLARRR